MAVAALLDATLRAHVSMRRICQSPRQEGMGIYFCSEHVGAFGWLGSVRCTNFVERLADIHDDIICVFDSDGQPDVAPRYSRR
jgi:hypothetical protein